MEPEIGHHRETGHPLHAHEDTDAGVRSAAILGGAFVILLVFGAVTGYLAFRFFNSPATVGPAASPLAPARLIPNGPRLQVNGHEDLVDYLNQQQHLLNTYGWVDQKAGVVRVPMNQAMDMVMKKGLPVRGQETKSKNASGAARQAAPASSSAQ